LVLNLQTSLTLVREHTNHNDIELENRFCNFIILNNITAVKYILKRQNIDENIIKVF